MRARPAVIALGMVLVMAAACSSTADPEPTAALTAAPSRHCASDDGLYDGLRTYLAEEAAEEPWIDRVSVCAGGLIEVDQAGLGEDAARDEALAVCAAAAGYLITNPPPPERADAPNPKEIGIIVADAEGSPVVLGAEDEAAAANEGEREREAERERDRESAREGEGDQHGTEAREPEPFRCFDPFA